MPSLDKKVARTYLKEARLRAGYSNRDTASIDVCYSPEVIGRHERGEIPLAPEDMIVYSDCYGRRDILYHYCAECAIGRITGKAISDRDLPLATLRLTRRLRKAARDTADTLESIADDGVLNDKDRPMFSTSLNALEELSGTITDFLFFAAAQGVKKEPSLEKERPQQPTTV
jgi:hypothetical protein